MMASYDVAIAMLCTRLCTAEAADVPDHRLKFEMADREALRMLERRLPLPAFDQLLKASHAFNVLAGGVVRTNTQM
jgi:glycyl-tRNA synthetase alpha subunit